MAKKKKNDGKAKNQARLDRRGRSWSSVEEEATENDDDDDSADDGGCQDAMGDEFWEDLVKENEDAACAPNSGVVIPVGAPGNKDHPRYIRPRGWRITGNGDVMTWRHSTKALLFVLAGASSRY